MSIARIVDALAAIVIVVVVDVNSKSGHLGDATNLGKQVQAELGGGSFFDQANLLRLNARDHAVGVLFIDQLNVVSHLVTSVVFDAKRNGGRALHHQLYRVDWLNLNYRLLEDFHDFGAHKVPRVSKVILPFYGEPS